MLEQTVMLSFGNIKTLFRAEDAIRREYGEIDLYYDEDDSPSKIFVNVLTRTVHHVADKSRTLT